MPTAARVLNATGPGGLYFGIGASLAQVGGKVALRFSMFDYLKALLRGKKGREVTAYGNLFAGMLSGAFEASPVPARSGWLLLCAQHRRAAPRYR